MRAGWRVYQVGLAADGEHSVGRHNGVVLLRRRRRRYRGSALARYASAYLGFVFWAARMVCRVNRRRTIHVIHANNVPNSVILAGVPARLRGARLILDIHGPGSRIVPEQVRRPSLDPSRSLDASRGRAPRVCGCGCRSGVSTELHRVVTESRGTPARKVTVVLNHPDGVLFPLLRPRSPSGHVGYHGTVAARMGVSTLVEAMRFCGIVAATFDVPSGVTAMRWRPCRPDVCVKRRGRRGGHWRSPAQDGGTCPEVGGCRNRRCSGGERPFHRCGIVDQADGIRSARHPGGCDVDSCGGVLLPCGHGALCA